MRRKSMKKVILAILIIFIPFTLIIFHSGCTTPPSPQELKTSMKILDVKTKWVQKEYQPWPPKLVLVPAISFQIKNVSDKPLTYINFNAIFRLRGESENLGDCFLAAIRGEPVNPGETSDRILLKSNFGVEGNSVEHFKSNPQWKTAIVKLFAQSKGSSYVLLGEWEVSRKIDFKPPEPVEIKKKQKEKKKRN